MPKIDNYKMFYKNLAITTKKKPLIDMQKIKSKESKYTATKKANQLQRYIAREKDRNRETTGQTGINQTNKKDDNCKTLFISCYFKCMWIKFST